MLAKSLKTPNISSAADEVNVKVTVTFPESFRGVHNGSPCLDFTFTESFVPIFSLSCELNI